MSSFVGQSAFTSSEIHPELLKKCQKYHSYTLDDSIEVDKVMSDVKKLNKQNYINILALLARTANGKHLFYSAIVKAVVLFT